MATVATRDEGRHPPGPERMWGESWDFDFAAPDGGLGGYVRLGLYPNLGVAWFWAALVGRGRRLVTVRDHEIALPRGAGLEVRGQGLWSAVNCETPLDHWSVGLEAFAIAMDDPAEAYRSGWGDRVGLGFDLEWEAVAPAVCRPGRRATGAGGYEQSSMAHGEILVGEEVLAFDGVGHRRHHWGLDDWWARGWRRAWGVLDDGTRFSTELEEAGLGVTVIPMAQAPLLVEGPEGRRVQLARALCRYRAADGRFGVGWLDCLEPSVGGH